MLVSEIYNNTVSVITEYKKNNFSVSAELMTKVNSKGLPWVIDILKKEGKDEWTYKELYDRFSQEFYSRGLVFNKTNTITLFFPAFNKTRKTIMGKKELVYTFIYNMII